MARISVTGDRTAAPTGCCPLSSTYKSTPSAYTSVAVVTWPCASCSGAAYSGVSGAAGLSRERARLDNRRITPLRVARDQLRDAEVQQLDLAIHADEHIGRLDISMHDQVCVRVGDGLQHIEKETDARLNPQRLLVAVAVDGLTVHVLENEVRLAHCRYARHR